MKPEEQTADRAVEPDFYKMLVESGLALLAKASDLESILREVVAVAMDISKADAGSLYVIRGRELEFMVARNLTIEARGERLPLEHFRLTIDHSTICGYVADTGETLFLNDVSRLPAGSPYRFNDSFDSRLGYRSQSMLVLPLTNSTGAVVGVLQMINHRQPDGFGSFPSNLLNPVRILARQAGMALSHALLSEALKQAQSETVYRLGLAAEARDKETGRHLQRVSHFARLLAKGSGQSPEFQELIYTATPLHDVGKIAIPDAILQKPGVLTPEERLQMQRHTISGHDMLAKSEAPMLRLGASIALTHHEKWDGTGYPNRLKETSIPFEGRVVALADVFDALCAKRCYKEAWTMERVLDFVRGEKGRHFDPELVEVFFAMWLEIEQTLESLKE